MKLLRKQLFRPVNDPLGMPRELNRLAEELVSEGYHVEHRGLAIVLKLEDGEIHFVAGDKGIWEYIFSGRED